MIRDKKAWEKRKKFFEKVPRRDWKKFDKTYNYNWYADRLKMANDLGFKYVSECTVNLYFKYMSYTKVAEKLGLSTPAIQRELTRLNIKLQPRGGYRPKDIRRGYHPRYWGDKVA
jgi:hypothetical protein